MGFTLPNDWAQFYALPNMPKAVLCPDCAKNLSAWIMKGPTS